MSHSTSVRRPPVWLAAAAVAAGWGAIYSIGRWTFFFAISPLHEDVRIWYVAAEAGLRYGWPSIYDLSTLHYLSRSFPAGEQHFGSSVNYVNPPLLAWLFAPLTAFPEPAAYGLWSLASLAALVWAWYVAAPYSGLAKVTLLLLALAIWPVLVSFYFGQPTIVMLGLVATAWWLCARDRPLAGGAALALATFLKPHLVVLVPLALLVSGRYRPVLGWIAGCALLGVTSILALGTAGLVSWWQALQYLESDPTHSYYTLANLFGFGPVTYVVWAAEGTTALVVARWRRFDLDLVYALGVLGSVAIAFHLHPADYSMLILAGWLVLRTSPPLCHRLWILIGVFTMQTVTLGTPTLQLLWDAGWLGILAFASHDGSDASVPVTPQEAGPGMSVGV